jgi:hypothetical protein
MLKRAGKNHQRDPEPGDLAVLCPACPQPGKNLPEDWENAPEDERSMQSIVMRSLLMSYSRWLYTLFLGGDANFRAVRKGVSNRLRDPSLVNGRAYFVEHAPYMNHLQAYSDLPQEVRPECASSYLYSFDICAA